MQNRDEFQWILEGKSFFDEGDCEGKEKRAKRKFCRGLFEENEVNGNEACKENDSGIFNGTKGLAKTDLQSFFISESIGLDVSQIICN